MSFYRQTGFTLIEMMITVAILAIIAAIAIPVYQGYVEEGRFGAAAQEIVQAQLILDDLATDGNLAVLDGGNEAVRGLYLRSGQLELGDPGVTPAGTTAWLDPWGNIYRYQRADNTTQDYALFRCGLPLCRPWAAWRAGSKRAQPSRDRAPGSLDDRDAAAHPASPVRPA